VHQEFGKLLNKTSDTDLFVGNTQSAPRSGERATACYTHGTTRVLVVDSAFMGTICFVS